MFHPTPSLSLSLSLSFSLSFTHFCLLKPIITLGRTAKVVFLYLSELTTKIFRSAGSQFFLTNLSVRREKIHLERTWIKPGSSCYASDNSNHFFLAPWGTHSRTLTHCISVFVFQRQAQNLKFGQCPMTQITDKFSA